MPGTTYRTDAGARRRRPGSGEVPRLEGRPGFVRVDTVHSGDRAGEKGACYVINMVDEATQYQ